MKDLPSLDQIITANKVRIEKKKECERRDWEYKYSGKFNLGILLITIGLYLPVGALYYLTEGGSFIKTLMILGVGVISLIYGAKTTRKIPSHPDYEPEGIDW